METFVESVRLSGAIAVQASRRKFRLHQSFLWEFAPFPEALPEIGDVDVTRQTLAAAIYAGLPLRTSDEKPAVLDSAPSLLSYIYSLATAYHTTHATAPTMRRAAERLAASGQQAAAARCLQIAQGEADHDTLALQDIAAFGIPAEEFVARVRPREASEMLELCTSLADSEEPIGVLGYVYTLERMALLNTAESIEAIERLMPAGVNATRCLRAHSSVGVETEHVVEALEFIATLPPHDRATIARAAYRTSHLMSLESSDYPGDNAMRRVLQALGGTQPLLNDLVRAS